MSEEHTIVLAMTPTINPESTIDKVINIAHGIMLAIILLFCLIGSLIIGDVIGLVAAILTIGVGLYAVLVWRRGHRIKG